MKISSLNTAIILSAAAFLVGIARLIVDVRFVPEVFEAMPEDQPGQTTLVILIFVIIYGSWLWALLAASRDTRRGLIALLIANLILAFGWGFGTVVSLCPTPCAVATPLSDIIIWLNVVTGLVAAITIARFLSRQNRNGR